MSDRFRFLVMLAVVVACAGCATFQPGAPSGVVDVIAHRGASHDAPENTLAAFELSYEMGADWFELDCYLTSDDVVIVIHDTTLDRTTDSEGPVAEVDLATVRTLDAGSWKHPRFAGEPLPTLGESLDLARDRIGVYVELKSMADDNALMAEILDMAADAPVITPELERQIIAAIEASGTRNLPLTRNAIAEIRERNMEDGVVIQAFSPIICAITRIEAPEIRVELLSGVKADEHADWERVCRWLFLLDLDGLNLHGDGVTPGRLAAIQGAGKSVAVWTINDRAAMQRFASWGVDAIITDRPDVCLEVLNRN